MNDDEMNAMAVRLEATGNFRVLRRLLPRLGPVSPFDGVSRKRLAILIDCETNGLNPREDEILELSMIPFTYTVDGRVLEVLSPYDQLRQPSRPIPPNITRLTGIDDAMVAGRVIDPFEVASFIEPAALLIAYNAGFDRKFAERLCPSFADKSWACAMTQVPWHLAPRFEGLKLRYLLAAAGFFHDGHRGLADCHATVELLARTLGDTGRSALAHLLEEARRTTWRLRATGASFKHKDWLRARSYRWSNGDDGGPKAWFIELEESAVDAEIDALRDRVFGDDWEPDLAPITARTRFSERTEPQPVCAPASSDLR